MTHRFIFALLVCSSLVACSSEPTTGPVDASAEDTGALDSATSDAGATPDLGTLPESHGSCTGPQAPSDVIRCFQFPAAISEASVRTQCTASGETFAYVCPAANLFGACRYDAQTWFYYTPASDSQRTQAMETCGGGTWVDY